MVGSSSDAVLCQDANQLITMLYHLIFAGLNSDHPVSNARKLHIHVDGGPENWNIWVRFRLLLGLLKAACSCCYAGVKLRGSVGRKRNI